MPTYEYKCLGCERRFEVFQSMTAEPLTECDECHGTLKRLIGAGAGIIFKGSGFYATDYRSDSYRQSAKTDSSPPAATTAASKESGSGGSEKAAATSSPKTGESTTKNSAAEGSKT